MIVHSTNFSISVSRNNLDSSKKKNLVKPDFQFLQFSYNIRKHSWTLESWGHKGSSLGAASSQSSQNNREVHRWAQRVAKASAHIHTNADLHTHATTSHHHQQQDDDYTDWKPRAWRWQWQDNPQETACLPLRSDLMSRRPPSGNHSRQCRGQEEKDERRAIGRTV